MRNTLENLKFPIQFRGNLLYNKIRGIYNYLGIKSVEKTRNYTKLFCKLFYKPNEDSNNE